MSRQPPLPYYPAQIVPLGVTLRTFDTSRPVVQYVVQDGLQVKVACLWNGQIVEKKFAFDQVAYVEVGEGWA